MDSNYNLGGLINRMKARLKDAEYDETDIIQFLNDAYFEILGDAEYQFLEKVYVATTQQAGPLLLPRDFQQTILLTADNEKGLYTLDYISKDDFFAQEREASTKNYKYTIFGNNLFYCVPNISDDEVDGEEQFYTLKLYYLAKPVALAVNTDVPVIPAEFGEALLLGALCRAEQCRDNFDYAQIYENKKNELVINMKARYCPRNQRGENRAELPVKQTLRH